MEQRANEALREESLQGRVNEDNLDEKIELLGGYHIDGQGRSSSKGKKYTVLSGAHRFRR